MPALPGVVAPPKGIVITPRELLQHASGLVDYDAATGFDEHNVLTPAQAVNMALRTRFPGGARRGGALRQHQLPLAGDAPREGDREVVHRPRRPPGGFAAAHPDQGRYDRVPGARRVQRRRRALDRQRHGPLGRRTVLVRPGRRHSVRLGAEPRRQPQHGTGDLATVSVLDRFQGRQVGDRDGSVRGRRRPVLVPRSDDARRAGRAGGGQLRAADHRLAAAAGRACCPQRDHGRRTACS